MIHVIAMSPKLDLVDCSIEIGTAAEVRQQLLDEGWNVIKCEEVDDNAS